MQEYNSNTKVSYAIVLPNSIGKIVFERKKVERKYWQDINLKRKQKYR